MSMPGKHVEGSAAATPEGWVPVERRWVGLDRRTIAPALVVLGLAIVMSVVPYSIDQAVSYKEEVAAGDEMQLDSTLGSSVRFVPTPGWGIADGLRVGNPRAGGTYPSSAEVVNGDVGLFVKVAPFDGDAEALLQQIRETTDALNDEAGFHVVGDPVPFQTATGDVGVIANYQATGSEGLLAALVYDGAGVEIVATGPQDTPAATVEDIARMIASVSYQEGGAA